MKKLLLSIAGIAALMVVASSAMAVQFPNATCPDTLSIVRLKTLLNQAQTCSPSTPNTTGGAGDSVNGVGGIAIGFDQIPTGYDVFLEQSDGQALSGLDGFTHGTNFVPVYNFALGDSVIFENARVANYYGDIEILSPNNNFSSPNVMFRKVSTGNPLPPFLHGNTTDFKELASNTYFGRYISQLVTLDGPVRVARANFLTGGKILGMLVVRDAATSDSVYIDYSKFTNIIAPAVGTVLQSISGVSNAASRGWRICPRSSADVIDTQPPGVSDTYAVADNQYRVVFDRDVTPATATNVANYTLGSFGTVNSAVMDGTAAVILTVSGTGLLHGQSETVTVNGVAGLANGIAITSPAAAPSFLAGVLSTGEMGTPNPDSLAATPCQDKSRYAGGLGDYTNGLFGPRSTITGIVTGIFGNLYYMQDAAPGLPAQYKDGTHRGVTVFAPPVALTQGHRYLIAGSDEEYYKENEFASISYVLDQGPATIPAPIPLTVAEASYDTCDAQQNLDDAKDYLSEMVGVGNVVVVQRFPTLPTNGFHVASQTSADTLFIENQNTVLGPNSTPTVPNPNYPAVGSIVNVIGEMHYTTNTSTPSARITPRSPADITIKAPASVGGGAAKLSFSVFPNPARTVNVSFALPKASNVELGVYDLFGRHVATIASGRFAAGTYQKAWSGLNDAGQKAHSGVYFYRLQAGSDVRTARTVLISD